MKKAYVYFGAIAICLGAIFTANISGAESKTATQPIDIYTVQPRLITEQDNPPSTLQGAVQNLVGKLPDTLQYTDVYQYKDIITTEAMKKIKPNQIILWRGHGSWDEDNEEPIILTGRDYDPTEAEAGVIVQDGYYEAITARYIEKYVGDISGSLIYLNVCESAHNMVIIDALLAKGARTVIGSTNTAEMTYSNKIQDAVVPLLGEVNPKTNNYYTINEAMATAKQQFGEKDPGSGGEIVIYGDKNYRITNHIPKPNGPLAPNTGFSVL